LLPVCVGVHQRQGLFEAGTRLKLVAAVQEQLREGQDGDRVLRLLQDGALVHGDGALVLALQLVQTRERHERAPLCCAAAARTLLEVPDESVELAVALAIELRESSERELRAGLCEHDRGVTRDERFAVRRVAGPLLGLRLCDLRRSGSPRARPRLGRCSRSGPPLLAPLRVELSVGRLRRCRRAQKRDEEPQRPRLHSFSVRARPRCGHNPAISRLETASFEGWPGLTLPSSAAPAVELR
jgi:hypothetical protein